MPSYDNDTFVECVIVLTIAFKELCSINWGKIPPESFGWKSKWITQMDHPQQAHKMSYPHTRHWWKKLWQFL